jgi:enoyl-CoA hydratase/carnithine racemase
MHGEVVDIWRDVDRDPTVNAVIITGARCLRPGATLA